MGKKSKNLDKPSTDLLTVKSEKKRKGPKAKLPPAVAGAVSDQLTGTSASDAIAAAATAKAAKKLRKQQKKEAKLQKAALASPENGSLTSPSPAAENGAQPSSKAKKRKSEEPAGVSQQPAAEPSSEKKAKKAKSKPALDGAGQGGSLLASVGDVELARSSRRLVRDLYTEHAAVSKMTKDELEKWQQERSIAVVGDSMKPVQAFQHSGK